MKPSEKIRQWCLDNKNPDVIASIMNYLDEQAESQEPKSLEEKCPNLGKFNCICSQCYKEAKPQEAYGFRDHRHCPGNDSPCGIDGKHRCCLCGKQVQEEPKEESDTEVNVYWSPIIEAVEKGEAIPVPLNYAGKFKKSQFIKSQE